MKKPTCQTSFSIQAVTSSANDSSSFSRKAAQKAQVWRVSKDGDYIDTFMRTDRIFQANVHQLADAMTSYDQKYPDEVNDYRDLWTTALRHAKRHAYDYEPEYSSMATVRYFEQEFHANSKKGQQRMPRILWQQYGNTPGLYLCASIRILQ